MSVSIWGQTSDLISTLFISFLSALYYYFLQPVLGGHLAIPRGWPLNTGATVLRFFSIHFTITGVKKIVCYPKDFITQRFIISRFHCTYILDQLSCSCSCFLLFWNNSAFSIFYSIFFKYLPNHCPSRLTLLTTDRTQFEEQEWINWTELNWLLTCSDCLNHSTWFVI